MDEREQVKPLAPAGATAYRSQTTKSEDEAISMEFKKLRKHKFIKCCGCIAAVFLILALILLILIFTVFKVKDPTIEMNSVKFQRLDLDIGSLASGSGLNVSLVADVSVKNPNIASFKFSNATTTIYYRGAEVAEAVNPPGEAKGKSTMRMNITIDVIPEKILAIPSLTSDVRSGALNISSFTSIHGRVKIIKIIKKHVDVRMNCTMTVNITTQAVQDEKCERHVSL